MSEHIFKNELLFVLLFLVYFHILHKNTFKMMDEKWLSYTCLKLIESAGSILRKIKLKFSEGSKAKSPSNIAFLFYRCYYKYYTFYFIFVIIKQMQKKQQQ